MGSSRWRDAKFNCGLVRLGEAGDPGTAGGPRWDKGWDEFRRRIDFVREVRGLNVTFLEALRDKEGNWEVPFFAVQDEFGSSASPKELIERNTPYRVESYRTVEPARADVETLSILGDLVEGDPGSSWIEGVVPRVQRHLASPDEVFDGLVGMDAPRETLMKISSAVSRHGRGAIECFHLIFAGNPGTGKSELASRLVSYLDLLGVTDGTGRLVKVGEADLVAKYVGHTAPKVKSVVERALGGLLFIDEFYAIASAPHFGQEAIDCLVDQLDAHRDDFVCVIAGYPEQLDATLDLNPGLRDRFGYRIDFPDYTNDELARIFCSMARGRGFEVRCEGALGPAMERLRASRGFSNARSVRRLVDHAICEASWAREESFLADEDVEAAVAQCAESPRRSPGFA